MKDPSSIKPLTAAERKRTASARAKQFCRDGGYLWDWCESYNAFTRRKSDLFGLFDLLYFAPGSTQLVGVQVTGGSNGNARIQKMLGAQQQGENDRMPEAVELWKGSQRADQRCEQS